MLTIVEDMLAGVFGYDKYAADAALRGGFLNTVAEHREIAAAWSEYQVTLGRSVTG